MQFLLLGAGEFLPWSAEAELHVLSTARPGPVAVLPTASALEGEKVFQRWAGMALAHYEEMGVEARVVPLRDREDASDQAVLEMLAGAGMFFFSGGNPQHLARVLDGTPVLEALLAGLHDGAVFAGCSAGAMVAGARGDGRGPAFWHVGLGLLTNVRFGVHWNRMPGYLPGLKELLVSGSRHGERHFIGIDEGTAIAGDGVRWRVFGGGGAEVRTGGERRRYAAGEEFELA